MFGWIKKIFRQRPSQSVAASWDYVPQKYVTVGEVINHPTRILASDEGRAFGLVMKIFHAKRQKKKHSHLLAELKALEVKE